MQKIDLFSIPVYLKKDFISDEIRLDILKHIKINKNLFNKLGSVGDVCYGDFKISHFRNTGKFKNGNNIIEYFTDNIPSCRNLKKDVQGVINSLSKEFGFNKLKLENSWITIQNKGSSLKKHSHLPAKLSGVFYLNVDEKSSIIYFNNPNPFIQIYKYDFDTFFNYSYVYVKPSNKDLLIFPAWLTHDSGNEINKTNNRVALSFNAS